MIRKWIVVSIAFAVAALGIAMLDAYPVSSQTPTETPYPTPVPTEQAAAVNAAVARMTKYGMENPSLATVLAITPTTWTDDCLDLPSGLPCHSQMVPGYAVELIKAGQHYVVRADADGKMVRVAASPAESLPDALVEWERNDGNECRSALIGTERMQYGFCGEARLTESSLQASTWRGVGGESQAEYWKQTYAPFTASTVAGTVVFTGTGNLIASAAEQRAIAEWAQERWYKHWWTYLNAVYDLDLGWTQRSAGFCGGLWIYRTGLAVAWNCEGSESLAMGFLKGELLDQFYAYLDGDKRWSISPNDTLPGVPPNTSLGFLWENRSANATEQDTQEMLQFLHEVYSTLTAGATVTGKVIAGYGAHVPVPDLPLWIGKESRGDPDARTDANGEFTLKGLPIGLDDVVDSHLAFQVPVTATNSTVNLGVLKYPLFHPPLFYWGQSPAPLTSLSDLLTQGEPITFTICQTDTDWTRPPEAVQSEQVWSRDPFAEQGEQFLTWWFRQPALVYDTVDVFEQSFPGGPNLDALASDWRYLTGLWTGDDLSHSQCAYEGKTLDGLLNRDQLEVWLLGHRAVEVKRLQMPYTSVYDPKHAPDQPETYKLDQPSEHFAVTVEPAPGFQIIRFAAGSDPLVVHIVENGAELITLPRQCLSRYSPDCAR